MEYLEQLLTDVVEPEYEDQPPNQTAVSQTKVIVNDLIFLSLPSASMVREPEGGIRFEWLNSTSHTVLIATNENTLLTFHTSITPFFSDHATHTNAADAVRWVESKISSSSPSTTN